MFYALGYRCKSKNEVSIGLGQKKNLKSYLEILRKHRGDKINIKKSKRGISTFLTVIIIIASTQITAFASPSVKTTGTQRISSVQNESKIIDPILNSPNSVVDPIDHDNYVRWGSTRAVINYNSFLVSAGAGALSGYGFSKLLSENFKGNVYASLLGSAVGFITDTATTRPDCAVETVVYRYAVPNANGLYTYMVCMFEYKNNNYLYKRKETLIIKYNCI